MKKRVRRNRDKEMKSTSLIKQELSKGSSKKLWSSNFTISLLRLLSRSGSFCGALPITDKSKGSNNLITNMFFFIHRELNLSGLFILIIKDFKNR